MDVVLKIVAPYLPNNAAACNIQKVQPWTVQGHLNGNTNEVDLFLNTKSTILSDSLSYSTLKDDFYQQK